jgi:23S rRNA pseudouridine1911/1915/1917 synthase
VPRQAALEVGPSGTGRRLDAWLADQLPGESRSRFQALIEQGLVLVDERPARAAQRLREGQRVGVTLPDPIPATPLAEDIPLTIVYQDAQLLVLDKPQGQVVHPGAGRQAGTLVNALLHHVRDLSGVGGVLRPGIVHRLDRDTSGLLVVAKDDPTHRALARQFAAREVQKEYVALVLGVPRPRHGRVSSPIGRDPHHRKRMSTRAPRGRAAETTFEVIEAFDDAALLRVRIHTGRTHQIRVHLASIGHPVVGDVTYGGRRPAAGRRPEIRLALQAFPRQALHAARLTFTHPSTGERLDLSSPLPSDIRHLIEILRSDGA